MSSTTFSMFTSNGAATVALDEDGIVLRTAVQRSDTDGDLTQLRGQSPTSLTAEQARDLAAALIVRSSAPNGDLDESSVKAAIKDTTDRALTLMPKQPTKTSAKE